MTRLLPTVVPLSLFTVLFMAGDVLAGIAGGSGPGPVAGSPVRPLRDLSTDRPDKTESPYTVDAGHFQIEADLISWTRNRGDGSSSDALDVGTINFKAGLTPFMDFQVIVPTYHYERTRTGGSRVTEEGFGDLTLRSKFNLWGNDEGRTALAVMPFVTLPTAGGDFGVDRAEAGIIVPLGVALAAGWGLGLMTEVDFVNDDAGGHTVHWINTITVGHDLTEVLGMYVEFFSEVPMENSSAWIGTVDVGFTYAIGKNMQLDAGVNIGVTDAADDLNPFVGFTVRF